MNNPPHQPQVDIEQHHAHLSPNIELPHIKTPSRNSFDDSLDAPHEVGQRSPGKVIAFIHKNQDEKMNFKKWILSLVSIGNMIMSPMIVLMGIQASSYGLSKLEADKALIIMGVVIFILALVTLIATIKLQKRVLFFMLYAFIVLLVFIAIFTVGIFSFQPDIQQWVYENWGHIRQVTEHFNFTQFEKDIRNDILSLGVFAVTIIVGILICVFAIIQILGFKSIRKRIVPLLSLLVIIFGSALVIIAIYSSKTAQYTNLPTWINALARAIGIFLMAVGGLGYYASIKRSRQLLVIYLGLLILIFFFMIYVAYEYFALAITFKERLDRDWSKIYNDLLKRGYNVTKMTFRDYVMMNLKFAGLYGMMYSCFVFISILFTYSKIKMLSKPEH